MKLLVTDPKTGIFALVAESPLDEVGLGSFSLATQDIHVKVIPDNKHGGDLLPTSVVFKPVR